MWWADNDETPQWARELHKLVDAEEWDKAMAMATAMLAERESGGDKALLYGTRGAIHVYHGEHDLAIAEFTRAVEAAPDVMNNYLCRGMMRMRKSKDECDAALADFNRVLDVESENPGAYCGRGWAYHEKGECDLAVADLNRAIELAPDFAEAYFHRGNVRTSKSEYAAAIADFNMALKFGYEDATTYILRGFAHGMLDKHKNAAADFERGVQLQPDHPMINDDMRELIKRHRKEFGGDPDYHELVGGHLFRGKWDEAVSRVSKLLPSALTEQGRAYLHSARGTAHFGRDDMDFAIADLTRALEIAPDNAASYLCRGIAYDKNGDCDLAIADFNKALELKPDFAEAHLQRGSAHNGNGDYDLAVADFNAAAKMRPNDTMTHILRAYALSMQGKNRIALTDINQALRLDPDNKLAREVRHLIRQRAKGRM